MVRIDLVDRDCSRIPRDNYPNTCCAHDLRGAGNQALADTSAGDFSFFPFHCGDRHPCFREFAAVPVESFAELRQCDRCFSHPGVVCLLVVSGFEGAFL